MANDLNRSIKIFIDGSDATNDIAKVEASIADLEQQLSSLNQSEANYAKKSKELQKEISNKNKVLADYKARIAETERVLNNLSGATYNQLLAVQKQVQRELKNTVPGTQQYTAALEQNRHVTEALTRAQAAMRVEVGSQGNVFSRTAGWINKYMVLISGAIASITGITLTARKCVNEFAELKEEMAGVKKYTGMTDEAIDDLNKSFKQMDTRTPRTRLNQLAQDAGRLGLQGKKDILEFVDAANIINVALGEDLGEDAVKQIGKLAKMFGEDNVLGLRGAMLATASAVNEVAQNSSAAEPYIVDFTAQVAGAANQAGIAQANLIGYASVLDQNMLRSEKAATAFQKVMMKMYQEPAKLAKLAGIDIKQFSDIVKKDANEALLMFFDALSKKDGLLDLAPLFKELKLQGEGAASVLSVLAGKIGDIRTAQKMANDAYRDGTSVISEYNIQNNTLQGGIEKAKNKFKEVVYELGEKLAPNMSKFISSTSLMIRFLINAVSTLLKYRREIVTAGVALGVFTGVMKIHTMWVGKYGEATLGTIAIEKLKTFWTKASTAAEYLYVAAKATLVGATRTANLAMIQFYATLGLNPFTGIALAITALATGLYLLATRQKGVITTTEAMIRIRKESTEAIAEERAKLETLFSVAQDETISKEDRRKAIKAINEISPEYLGNITLENVRTQQVTQAKEKYIEMMKKEAMQKAASNLLTEKTSELLKLESELYEAEIGHRKALSSTTYRQTGFTGYEGGIAILEKKVANVKISMENLTDVYKSFMNDKAPTNETQRTLETVNAELEKATQKLEQLKSMQDWEKQYMDSDFDVVFKDVKKHIKELEEEKLQLTAEVVITSDGGGTGEEESEKERKKKLQAEKAEYARQQAELKERYLAGNDEKWQTEKQFNKAMEQLQLDHLQRSIKIAGQKSNEAADYQNQINDIKIKQKKEAIQEELDAEKLQYELQQEELKEIYASGRDENLRTEAAYNEAMEQLTIRHLQRVLQVAGLNADERRKVEKQLLDFKVKCIQDEEKSRKKLEETEQKRKDDIAKKEKRRLEQQAEQYRQYGEQIGETVGQLIINQENALQSFADTMIDILFDVLSQMIDIEIAKATGVAVGAVARASAESFAQPDSVATFGASGAARAAILSGLIMGALAAAKSALKGLIKRGSSSSSGSSSDDSDSPKTATVKVSQWASGNYDVIGQDDGKLYRNVPFLGAAPTGIVHRTSLVSENGAELIVNAEDLQRLQKHINYPLVLQAINDARNNQVPQRASGNYNTLENAAPSGTSIQSGTVNLDQFLIELKALLKQLRYIKAYITLRDLEEAQERDKKSKEPFTKKKS